MLEALACGTPVAAYPVAGPLDVVGCSDGGVLDATCAGPRSPRYRARARARARALEFDWDAVSRQFLSYLAPIAGRQGDVGAGAAAARGLIAHFACAGSAS